MLDEFRRVRGFLAVARCGSFTQASLELHVSQPALTVQIQQLETALGVRLLERNRRKVALTQAGHDLFGRLERLMLEVDSIMGAGRDLAELRRGIVTVAAVPSLAATLLPAALAVFIKQYPGISVRLRDSVGNLLDLVKSEKVDFAVGGEIHRDRDVAVQDLYAEPLCLFVPEPHPLARRRRVTVAELADHATILPQRPSSLRNILDVALERQKLSLTPTHETSHMSTTIGMVSAGLGVAILPLRAIESFASPGVRCIELYQPAIDRRVVIASRAGRTPSPAVQRLIDILHQKARALPKKVPRRTAIR